MRGRLVTAAALAAAFVLGIGGTLVFQHREWLSSLRGGSRQSSIVVIGLDGADWNLIEPLVASGRMPHVASLVERGARARLLTLNPTLSPVIWTTIATGVKPERHGIVDFTAVNRQTGEAVPVTSNLRRVPALWNLLSDQRQTVGFVGWWASYPAERVDGYVVSDRIAYQLFGVTPDQSPDGKVFPAEAYAQVKPLIVDPAALPESLLKRFFDDPSVLTTSDPEEQELLHQFRTILASTESYRAIAAALETRYDPRIASVYFEGTDTVAHLFMRYRPPQMAGVDPEKVRKFGGIIDRFYEYADELVGEIVARHGPDATYILVSDHGFRSDRDRPATTDSRVDRGRGADWHRKYGILVLSGPPVKPHTEIREATVFDVAPTVLALASAPIPHDLDGRVLTEAFTETFLREHPLRTLSASGGEGESTSGGASGSEGAGAPTPVATSDDAEIRERLISLGYLSVESNNAHNNRGILLLAKGEYDQAIAEFRAAMQDGPEFAAAYVNIARAYWQKGDTKAALENLGTAGRLDPRMREVPLMLGNIALKDKNLDVAESRFLEALSLEPNDTDTLNCLGLVYDARGDFDRAEVYFRKAVEVDADYAEGYNNLGNIAKKRGDAAQAESWYKKGIEADPFFMGSYANLALVFQERGEFEQAADLYRQALEKDSRNSDLHNNLGSLLFRRGDLHAAEEEFRKAIELDRSYAEGHNSLGVVFGAQGKDSEERAAYEKAIALKPGYTDAIFNLALWLVRHDDDRAAEAKLREVLHTNPGYVPALGTMAGIRLRRNDARGALEFLNKALALQPRNARMLTLLGQTQEALGNRAEAERAYRRSLELQPGQKEVIDRLAELGAKPAAP